MLPLENLVFLLHFYNTNMKLSVPLLFASQALAGPIRVLPFNATRHMGWQNRSVTERTVELGTDVVETILWQREKIRDKYQHCIGFYIANYDQFMRPVCQKWKVSINPTPLWTRVDVQSVDGRYCNDWRVDMEIVNFETGMETVVIPYCNDPGAVNYAQTLVSCDGINHAAEQRKGCESSSWCPDVPPIYCPANPYEPLLGVHELVARAATRKSISSPHYAEPQKEVVETSIIANHTFKHEIQKDSRGFRVHHDGVVKSPDSNAKAKKTS